MNEQIKPYIIAHRGNSSEAPENTIAAIKKALEIGVDFVEIDIRLSADHIPVVIHDASLTRVTGQKHVPHIQALPFSKIQEFDVGTKFGKSFEGEKIPRLIDVLGLNWGQAGLMVEIKEGHHSPKEMVDAVVKEITSASPILPRLIIGSFSVNIFEESKKMGLERIGIVEKKEYIERFIQAGAKRMAVWHKIITKDLMKLLLAHKIEVWSFTVDDNDLATSLVDLGVRGIISNVPKKFLGSTKLST